MSSTKSSRKRQTRLEFTPLPSSSPASSSYPQQIRDRAARISYNSPSPAKRRKVQDDKLHGLAITTGYSTPDPSNQSLIIKDESDSEPLKPSRRTSTKKRSAQQQNTTGINLSSPVKAAIRPLRGFFSSQKQGKDDSSEHSSASSSAVSRDPGSLQSTSAKRRRVSAQKEEAALPSSPLPDTNEEDDSDDVVVLSSKKRKTQPMNLSSEDEEPTSSFRKRRLLRRLQRGPGSETETIKPAPGTPKVSLHALTQEQQEVQDDVLDLQTSDSEPDPPSRQSRRASQQKSAREIALDRLKRRRAGEEVVTSEERSDDGDIINHDDEEIEEDEQPLPHWTTRREMFTRDEDDEGFITDDGDQTLGAPADMAHADIPLAFTRYASMKAKELFKFAIEWMVQKKLNPAFQTNDEVYGLAFKKLDDEVKGLAGSKFISSAWTPQFMFALRARPEIAFGPIDRNSDGNWMRDKCDACNRSGHPATFEVQFQGRPYHSDTLEEVAGRDDTTSDDSGDDEDDDGDDQNARDADGRAIEAEDKIFYVGKFCMANAETAHALQHWRFHLYEWVVEWLEGAGFNTAEQIVKRDKWSTRKRRKHANKVVDVMEEQGKVKELYRDFKSQVDRARSSKQGRWTSSP